MICRFTSWKILNINQVTFNFKNCKYSINETFTRILKRRISHIVTTSGHWLIDGHCATLVYFRWNYVFFIKEYPSCYRNPQKRVPPTKILSSVALYLPMLANVPRPVIWRKTVLFATTNALFISILERRMKTTHWSVFQSN